MSNSPLISVIMGVYNISNEKVIKKSVESILKQTYENFEFIICDDGSTDNTLELVKKITRKDKRVIIIKNKINKGLAYTLNHCLEYARGEYIARMDADDYSHPSRFEKQIEFLQKNSEYSMVSCNANLFDESGIWGELKYPEIIKKEDFLFNSPIIHPTIMIKKEELKKVNNYCDIKRTLRCEDYDLFMRLFANGCQMYTLQDKLFDYREDKDNYARRKYRYRITNMQTRLYGFKLLNLMPKGYIYAIKPLIVGLIPVKILNLMRYRKSKES